VGEGGEADDGGSAGTVGNEVDQQEFGQGEEFIVLHSCTRALWEWVDKEPADRAPWPCFEEAFCGRSWIGDLGLFWKGIHDDVWFLGLLAKTRIGEIISGKYSEYESLKDG
jgi:hypothetical protein